MSSGDDTAASPRSFRGEPTRHALRVCVLHACPAFLLLSHAADRRAHHCASSFLAGAHGIALAFDLTQRSSYQSIPSWLKQLTDNADEGVSVALVGTKSDLLAVKPADDPAVVSKAECEALAKQFSVPVFYTSAKLNEGIAEAFEWLARDALKKMQAGKAAAASGAGGGAGAGAAGGAGGASGVVKPGKDEKAGGASGCAC